MTSPNGAAAISEQQRFYDEAFGDGGLYAQCYDTIPEAAKALNRYNASLVASVLDLRPGARVLDLGCGMGHTVRAWQSLGYEVVGLEISEVAIRKSGLDCILHGDATDLSRFKYHEFDLVYSSQFLEHLTDAQIAAMCQHQLRIGKHAAHFIAPEAGVDPGHINIKRPDQWTNFLSKWANVSVALANPLETWHPIYVQLGNTIPTAFLHCLQFRFFPFRG